MYGVTITPIAVQAPMASPSLMQAALTCWLRYWVLHQLRLTQSLH